MTRNGRGSSKDCAALRRDTLGPAGAPLPVTTIVSVELRAPGYVILQLKANSPDPQLRAHIQADFPMGPDVLPAGCKPAALAAESSAPTAAGLTAGHRTTSGRPALAASGSPRPIRAAARRRIPAASPRHTRLLVPGRGAAHVRLLPGRARGKACGPPARRQRRRRVPATRRHRH